MPVSLPFPPSTHSVTLTTDTVEFTPHDRANRVTIRPITNAIRWAFAGVEDTAPTLGAAGSGDDAGLDLAGDAERELTLSVGRGASGASIFLEPTVNPTIVEIISEE
jgi:hypothetical protein